MKAHRMNPEGLFVSESCRGDEVHTLRFNAKGQLCLLHHDQEREKAFEDLGGWSCWCRGQLEWWQKAVTTEGPPYTVVAKYQVREPFRPYLADCDAEHERRKNARKYVETWDNTTVYQRPAFLQRLLNRLLSKALGLADHQWLTLKYTSSGWYPATLHYPYPGDDVRNIFPLGVRSDYVAQIYKPGLSILQDGLTLFVPGSNPQVARQLVPRTHPVAGLCLARRFTGLVPDAACFRDPESPAEHRAMLEPWPVELSS